MTAEKAKSTLNWISIVSGIATILAVLTFFTKGIGSIVEAQTDIEALNTFKEKQETINESNIKAFASIDTNVEWIKDYLKTNLRR